MLDPGFLKRILQLTEDGGYEGLSNCALFDELAPDDDSGLITQEQRKLIYHLDEIFKAGLMRCRDMDVSNNWGIKLAGGGNSLTLIEQPLVLTPAGSEFLEELNKPKGLELLKTALKRSGMAAGSTALTKAVGYIADQLPSP